MQLQLSTKKIPVNLIIGHLGSGKTTAIKHLLTQKPQNEKWAIIVNEFGEVSVDHALLVSESGDNDYIKEIPGGCICCTSGLELQLVLTQIIVGQKPDRIIIEPTGAGHPAGIIDTLTKGFGKLIELQAVIGLFDPDYIISKDLTKHPFILDQANLCDLLLLTKTDQTSLKNNQLMQEWAEDLYPPKHLIASIESGEIKPELLKIKNPQPALSFAQNMHVHHHHNNNTGDKTVEPEIESASLGKPLFFHNIGFGKKGYGWVFHPEDIFHHSLLTNFLNQIQDAIRVKGIFNTHYGKISYNRLENQKATIDDTVYRKDSRLEIIFSENTITDISTIEKELLSCLLKNS